MADNSVFINGVAEGAFTAAFEELPEWATQATALQIEKHLRKSYDVQSKMLLQLIKSATAKGTALSPEEMKKVHEELDKMSRGMKRYNEEDLKAQKRRKDKEKLEKDELASGKKKKDNDVILETVLSGLSAAGTAVIGVNKDYIDIYDQMYKSGLNVLNGNNSTANGFEGLNQMVNLTGMRLQTFQKGIEANLSAVNAVGLNKFAKTVSMSTKGLNELGFYNEDLVELIGTSIEAESNYSNVRRKSSEEIMSDALKFGTEINKVSKLLGISQKQLQETIKSASKTPAAPLLFAKYGEEMTKKIMAMTAGFGPEMQEKLMEMLAVSSPYAQTAIMDSFQKMGMGDIGSRIYSLLQQGMNGPTEDFAKNMDGLIQELQQSGRLKDLEALYDVGGREALALIGQLSQVTGKITESTDAQNNNAKRTAQAAAELNTQFESLKATTQKMFYPLIEQVDAVSNSLRFLNSNIDKAVAAVNAETRSWIGVGVALAGLIATVLVSAKVMKVFNSGIGLLGSSFPKTAAGISKGATGVGSALKQVGGFFLRLLKPMAVVYAGWQLGTAIGETLREMITGVEESVDYFGIIKGILRDIGGWFKEIWESISTFVSELATTISTYIGKFADMVGSAAMVVYDGIANVGKKILEYAPWLSTVGQFIKKGIDAIGGVIKEVIEFGKSYIDALKTFVSKVVSKFANKMSFGLFGSKDDSTEVNTKTPRATLSESTDLDIVKVIKQMSPPEAMSIPTSPAPTTISSVSDVGTNKENTSPSQGVPSASPVSAVPGLDKPARTADINNLLSYQGSLLEQILLSTNNLVSVNKDILRYARTSV